MKNRTIRKVAVLGSGIMGSRIACHFANVGVEVLLLDISPKELTEDEKKNGLTLDDLKVKNRIVQAAFNEAIKSKPDPLYDKRFAERVTLGNFDDDLKKIKTVDWTIEVVVENLEIKKKVFEQVEQFRAPGTLISSNTSGIPIQLMLEDRSVDFQKHFCGTHFFNPPRYLRLLEIIPTSKTDTEIVKFLLHYGDLFLGKETVLCKDTPAFIANRIGIYAIMSSLHCIEKMSLSINEVDKLTGPVIGRAKSATFRTLDVVGLDTVVHVANGLLKGLPHDESKETFVLPKSLQSLFEKNWLGDKTGHGYYKKTKEGGKTEILELNLDTFDYQAKTKKKHEILDKTKDIESLSDRLKLAISDQGVAGDFYRATFFDLFRYCSLRIPEVSDELYKIDQAVSAGFGWEMGPFQTWDVLGVQKVVKQMDKSGLSPAAWVIDFVEAGNTHFYKYVNGRQQYYDSDSKAYKSVPGKEDIIILDGFKENDVVFSNPNATVYDIGDGVLNLEFHSKMNSIGAEVIEGIHTAIAVAEKDFRGLVIGNEGQNFSAGANLAMLFMHASEMEFDEVDMMVRQFQNVIQKVRYSNIPVVAATSGLALGGGCELSMHCDRIQAHAETYMGLVEFGVGVIPAGCGSKEMVQRVSDSYLTGDPELNRLQETFMTIATAKVGTSANEIRKLGFMNGHDQITLNRSRLLADAKTTVLKLADAGYKPPLPRQDIKVHGKTGIAMFEAGIAAMQYGNYITDHDALVARKLSWVMNGGDLSAPTNVSEEYLLDLEREAFVSLTGEKKTLERIHSILFKGKPLRN